MVQGSGGTSKWPQYPNCWPWGCTTAAGRCLPSLQVFFPIQIGSALLMGLVCTRGARAAMALPCVPLLLDAEGNFPAQQELQHPKCSAQAGRGGRDEGLADTEL